MRFTDEELAQVEGTDVIAYSRESSVRNEHKVSMDIQEMAQDEACRNLKLNVVRRIVDSDKTGRNFERKIQEAIQAVMRGEAKHILVYNLSRFGRAYWECIDYCRSLRAEGHLLISTDRREGVIDINTAEGRDKAHDAFSYAADQSDRIGEAWSNAIKLRRSKGLNHANTERWGYMWCSNAKCKVRQQCRECAKKNSEKFCKKCPPRPKCENCTDKPQIPDPAMKQVVIETFDRLIAGEGIGAVVRDLNNRGFRAPKGGQWSTTQLYSALDTGFHAGYIRSYGMPRSERPSDLSGRKLLKNAVYERGAQHAIISEEKWKAYQELRSDTGIDWGQYIGKAKYAESGLIFCVMCGSRMSGWMSGYSVRWRCGGYQTHNCLHFNGNGEIISGLVYSFLEGHVKNPAFLEEVERSLRAHLAAINAQPVEVLEKYEKQEVSLVAERRALISNFNRKKIEEEDYDAEKARIDAEIRATQHQISLLVPRNVPTFPPASYIKEVFESWGELPNAKKRAVLHSLIWRIEVTKGGVQDHERYEIIPLWDAHLQGLIRVSN